MVEIISTEELKILNTFTNNSIVNSIIKDITYTISSIQNNKDNFKNTEAEQREKIKAYISLDIRHTIETVMNNCNDFENKKKDLDIIVPELNQCAIDLNHFDISLKYQSNILLIKAIEDESKLNNLNLVNEKIKIKNEKESLDLTNKIRNHFNHIQTLVNQIFNNIKKKKIKIENDWINQIANINNDIDITSDKIKIENYYINLIDNNKIQNKVENDDDIKLIIKAVTTIKKKIITIIEIKQIRANIQSIIDVLNSDIKKNNDYRCILNKLRNKKLKEKLKEENKLRNKKLKAKLKEWTKLLNKQLKQLSPYWDYTFFKNLSNICGYVNPFIKIKNQSVLFLDLKPIRNFINSNVSVGEVLVKAKRKLVCKFLVYPPLKFFAALFYNGMGIKFCYTKAVFKDLEDYYSSIDMTETTTTYKLNNLILYYNEILNFVHNYNSKNNVSNSHFFFNIFITTLIYNFLCLYKNFMNLKTIVNYKYSTFSFILYKKQKGSITKKYKNKNIKKYMVTHTYYEKKKYNMLFYINNIVSKFFTFFYLFWINLYCQNYITNNDNYNFYSAKFNNKNYLNILNLYTYYFNSEIENKVLGNLNYLNNNSFFLYFKGIIINKDNLD